MNLIFVPHKFFKEMYEWAKEHFGTPYNMLFKTGETAAVWTVIRSSGFSMEYSGHIFMFDDEQDLNKFRKNFEK